MKKYLILGLVIMVSLLGGCNKKNPVVVTLYNVDGTEYVKYEYEDLQEEKKQALPILDQDNMIFVGWDNGTEVFYDSIPVTSDVELTAVFEDPEETILYTYTEEFESNVIEGYIGEAQYLKIPQYLGDNLVTSIEMYAFENSSLIEVLIPNSLYSVGMFAFKGSEELTKVEFYGTPIGENEVVMSGDEYDQILADNIETCTILSEEITGEKTFSDGCPIIEVISYNSITVSGVTYHSYYVMVDVSLHPDGIMHNIGENAFENCISLESIVLPSSYRFFNPRIFNNNPLLTDITFSYEELEYKEVDRVIYSADETELIYYPSGLTSETFEIPEGVTLIRHSAFTDNEYIEEITISSTVNDLRGFSFYNLPNLKAFIVDEENGKYTAIDGILLEKENLEDEFQLIRYPSGKTTTDYVVADNIISIGEYAFAFNKVLENITFNNNILSVGPSAFIYTENITTLDFPSTVSYIGYGIGVHSNIDTIIIRRGATEGEGITSSPGTFVNNTDYTVYVPDEAMEAYVLDMFWSRLAEQLKPLSEYTE